MTATIINFTSIPPRMGKLQKVVDGLRAQTARIDGIILWVPKTYRRTDFRGYSLPVFPRGIEVRQCDEDFGPATKILPAVQAFAGQDVRLIYCDDDELYFPEWADALIRGSLEHPKACVAVNGLNVASVDYEMRARSASSLWRNRLTLGLYGRYQRRFRRPPRPGIGPVDICQGFGGVLVRPEFFGPEVYSIPDILWTVDDIWLSGHLAMRGVPIQRISARKLCQKSDLAGVHDLTSYSYESHDRISADHRCVQYYRETYGVWTSAMDRSGS
jgi:hypothetical protein